VILVTGATGRVGYPLLAALADAGVGADVTAMVRVAAKAADLPGEPRHVVATFDDPPASEVLREFDRIFLLSAENEEQAELETVFIDAIAAAGHRPHVVKVCADGFRDPGCEVRFMRSHRQVAAHLDALSLPVTYLAAATYLENILASAEAIRRTGTIEAPAGQGRVGWVAAADVARAAARVLTTRGHEGATYVLTGPQALGYADVAELFGDVFAWQVDYADQSPELALETMLANGLSRWEADGELERFDWIRKGGAAGVTDTVRDLTGIGAQSIGDWLSESRAGFLAAPATHPRRAGRPACPARPRRLARRRTAG
jgi:NAD(P)H dehydrogenase (quinone)